ncbi:UNVERIFIED_CONTAM: hypothetical protein NCL1_16429 [Trichonephila clavipes]
MCRVTNTAILCKMYICESGLYMVNAFLCHNYVNMLTSMDSCYCTRINISCNTVLTVQGLPDCYENYFLSDCSKLEIFDNMHLFLCATSGYPCLPYCDENEIELTQF